MLFKRIISEGLAHYSYIFGSGRSAIVIDPRRDIDIYLQLARENDLKIIYILETHRHEDFLLGSVELAQKCKAEIFHADTELDYQYGKAIKAGQIWQIGEYQLEALFTPGHTPGAYSFLLKEAGNIPWLLFSGDSIMAGDLGRTDLMAHDITEEMTEILYTSLQKKILPLPDGVIICPAHGSGSVCGSDISEREWTTLGTEKALNPKLRFKTKKEFLQNNAKILEKPPYFSKMEELNLSNKIRQVTGQIMPLTVEEVAELSEKKDYQILDVRSNLDFSAAHIEDSIFIWKTGLANFAGWFLAYDKQIILVCDPAQIDEITIILSRIGYDNIIGYLAGGLLNWHRAGSSSRSIKTYNVQKICQKLDQKDNGGTILDIRSNSEIKAAGKIKNSLPIPLTQLLQQETKIPRDKTIYIFCGTGLRSMLAASLLNRIGLTANAVILGGLSAWNSSRFPVCDNINLMNKKEVKYDD